MSYEEQDNAIRSRIADQWGETTPIKWPNVAFDNEANEAYIDVFIDDVGVSNASIGDPGNNISRHVGRVVLMILVPLSQGDGEALQYADQAAAMFKNWSHPASGLVFEEPPFVRRLGQQGRWWQVNVLCPFRRDTIG